MGDVWIDVQRTSTANLAILGFGHNGTLSVCSVAEHGNQYTPRCFSNFAALGSFTHVLRYSPLEPGIAWQPGPNTNQLPCCDAYPVFTMGKLTSASLYLTWNLRPSLKPTIYFFPASPFTRSSVAVESLTGATAESFVAFWSKPLGKMLAPAHVSIKYVTFDGIAAMGLTRCFSAGAELPGPVLFTACSKKNSQETFWCSHKPWLWQTLTSVSRLGVTTFT